MPGLGVLRHVLQAQPDRIRLVLEIQPYRIGFRGQPGRRGRRLVLQAPHAKNPLEQQQQSEAEKDDERKRKAKKEEEELERKRKQEQFESAIGRTGVLRKSLRAGVQALIEREVSMSGLLVSAFGLPNYFLP